MRHHLVRDFDLIYVLDLGGNVRKNPKLSGTTHNVFGIQVGVSMNFFIRLPGKPKSARRQAKILYHTLPGDWRKVRKFEFLEEKRPSAVPAFCSAAKLLSDGFISVSMGPGCTMLTERFTRGFA